MNAARQHTDGERHSGDTTVLLKPIVGPKLCATDVIGTYLSLRAGFWVDAQLVRAAVLSHGFGLNEFATAAAKMIADRRILVDSHGAWSEGNP